MRRAAERSGRTNSKRTAQPNSANAAASPLSFSSGPELGRTHPTTTSHTANKFMYQAWYIVAVAEAISGLGVLSKRGGSSRPASSQVVPGEAGGIPALSRNRERVTARVGLPGSARPSVVVVNGRGATGGEHP